MSNHNNYTNYSKRNKPSAENATINNTPTVDTPIYGTVKVINGISHHPKAKWYPITGKNNAEVIKNIKNALKGNCIVLFEQRNPVHTVAFVGYDKKGRLMVIDNGKVKKSSVRAQVKNKALHGGNKHTNWFKSSDMGAGYVIVRR